MTNQKARRVYAVAAICAIAIGAILTAVPAQADSGISPTDRAAMRATWDTYGVPAATQNRLLAALERGHLWDSLDGSTPTSTQTRAVPNGEETIERFADGSISVTTAAVPAPTGTGMVTPLASFGNCSTLASSQYSYTKRCNVSTNVVVATAAYSVTYTVVSGSNTTIDTYSGIATACLGGTCSNNHMVLDRKTQSGSTPASLTGWFRWTHATNIASRDFWLNFQVVGAVVTVSNN